jgi:transposase
MAGREEISDEVWAVLAPLFPSPEGDGSADDGDAVDGGGDRLAVPDRGSVA